MNRSEQVEFERQYLTQVQIFRYGYQDESLNPLETTHLCDLISLGSTYPTSELIFKIYLMSLYVSCNAISLGLVNLKIFSGMDFRMK